MSKFSFPKLLIISILWSIVAILHMHCKPSGLITGHLAQGELSDPGTWQKLDSLYENRFFREADTLSRQISNTALKEDNTAAYVLARWKAWKYTEQFRQKSLSELVHSIRSEIAAADGARKSLLSLGYASWLSEVSMRYLYGHIAMRTDKGKTEDPENWSQQQWHREWLNYTLNAVELAHQYDQKLDDGHLLINEGLNTPWFGEHLFELVVREAIYSATGSDYFMRRIKPHPLQFDSALFDSDFDPKVTQPENNIELIAYLYQAISAYYRDAERDVSRADFMLKQLNWARSVSMLPEKDSLYYQALLQKTEIQSENQITADFLTALGRFHWERVNTQFWTYFDDSIVVNENQYHRDKAVEFYTAASKNYPESRGGIEAAMSLLNLNRPHFTLHSEEVYLQGSHPLILIRYRNLSAVHALIYRIPADPDFRADTDQKSLRALSQRSTPVSIQRFDLPLGNDFFEHAAELSLTIPDSEGRYIVIVSDSEDPAAETSRMAGTEFAMSNLALVTRRENEQTLFSLHHRDTGFPVAGVKLHFFEAVYSRWENRFDHIELDSRMSDQNGMATFSRQPGMTFRVLLTQGSDSLLIREQFYAHAPRVNQSVKDERIHFFTDRSIYRPGQTVYFKGLIISIDHQGIPTPLAGKNTKVTLLDANSRPLAAMSATTDRFGSVSGSFQLPQQVLQGNFTLSADLRGAVSFRVESYRPPGFEVSTEFEGTNIRPGDSVLITGTANTFAGVPLSHARVQYEVTRSTYFFPRPMMSYSYGMQGETFIHLGETTTAEDGSFAFRVVAEDVPGGSGQGFARLNYTVKTVVTDGTGEQQDTRLSFEAGRFPVPPEMETPEMIFNNEPLEIRFSNVDIPVDHPNESIRFRILKLEVPLQKYISRYWEQPDQMLIDREEYARMHPGRPYRDEADPGSWPVAGIILDTAVSGITSALILPPGMPGSGLYRLEVYGLHADKMLSPNIHHSPLSETVFSQKNLVIAEPGESHGYGLQKILTHLSSSQAEPCEKVKISWLLPPGVQYYRFELSHNGQVILVQRQMAGAEQEIELTIQEEHRGNLHFEVFALAYGRYFRNSGQINVPWSNKKLTVNWHEFQGNVEPGQSGNWQLSLHDQHGQPVEAQVALSVYDRSLDYLAPHRWQRRFYPTFSALPPFAGSGFTTHYAAFWSMDPDSKGEPKIFTYRRLKTFNEDRWNGAVYFEKASIRSGLSIPPPPPPGELREEMHMDMAADMDNAREEQAQSALRTQFETLSLFSIANTSINGRLIIPYTMQHSVTEWRVMGWAHTTGLQYIFFDTTLVTSKAVMLQSSTPRFLQQGDNTVLTARLSNTTDAEITGTVSLLIKDGMSGVQLPWMQQFSSIRRVAVPAGNSIFLAWPLEVPRNFEGTLEMETAFSGGRYHDGEKRIVPVLSLMDNIFWAGSSALAAPDTLLSLPVAEINRILRNVETAPITFSVELTTHPAWIALKSLPAQVPSENASTTQLADYYAAMLLASALRQQIPDLDDILQQWKSDSTSLISDLEKNPNLKTLPLEQTPWMPAAEKERQQRQAIVQLFDDLARPSSWDLARNRLAARQSSQGGFPWFEGGRESAIITARVIETLGIFLEGDLIPPAEINTIRQVLRRAALFLDQETTVQYNRQLHQQDVLPDDYRVSAEVLHRMYARSLVTDVPVSKDAAVAYARYTDIAANQFNRYSIGNRAILALLLHKQKDPDRAKHVVQSIRQEAVNHPEKGMFWQQPAGYQWHEANLRNHILAFKALKKISPDMDDQMAMIQWLLFHKQHHPWYKEKDLIPTLLVLSEFKALFQINTGIGMPNLILNGHPVMPEIAESGSGYAVYRWSAEEIPQTLESLTFSNAGNGFAWLGWQLAYRQPEDVIESTASDAVGIQKQLLYLHRGEAAYLGISQDTFKSGDQVMVRLMLSSDRSLSFVHIRDGRAAGFEPVNTRSGYHWQEGISMYRQFTDSHTDIFIEHMHAGNYVLEYPLYAFRGGNYSTGVAQIMSYYNPAISVHTSGGRVLIE